MRPINLSHGLYFVSLGIVLERLQQVSRTIQPGMGPEAFWRRDTGALLLGGRQKNGFFRVRFLRAPFTLSARAFRDSNFQEDVVRGAVMR